MPRYVRPGSSRLSVEQLRKVRIPFFQRATLVNGAGGEELFLVDVGLCGAFAEREQALPVGERVTLTFKLPGNERPIVASCRVAWWHPPGGRLVSKSLPAGVGLEFVDISEQDRGRLHQHLLDYLDRDPLGRRFHRPWPLGEGEGVP